MLTAPAPSARTAAVAARYALAAATILAALALLMIAWEFRLAPIRPGGSWLLLKALPPLLLLPKIIRGDVYAFKWTPLVLLFYFTEGIVRAWSESGTSRLLASVEIALSLAYIVCCWLYLRTLRSAPR